MLSPLWRAEWRTAVARRGCRKAKEFVLRNVFTSRYVIIRGLSEFMTNYHRLVALYRYVTFAPAAPQEEKDKLQLRLRYYDIKDSIVKTDRLLERQCRISFRDASSNLIYSEIKIPRTFLRVCCYCFVARENNSSSERNISLSHK